MSEIQLVIFDMAGEYFGVEISTVESIIKMQTIVAVPHAPDFVEGVTNLRGVILPVIDLRKRLGMEKVEPTKDTRVIVVSLGEKSKVGLVVDGVSEVLTITDSVVEPAPAMVTSVDTAFITGIAKIDQRPVVLLDLSRILSSNENKELGDMPMLPGRS
jgi:purine-binding chemotaxis protein CheW